MFGQCKLGLYLCLRQGLYSGPGAQQRLFS